MATTPSTSGFGNGADNLNRKGKGFAPQDEFNATLVYLNTNPKPTSCKNFINGYDNHKFLTGEQKRIRKDGYDFMSPSTPAVTVKKALASLK